MTTQRKDDTKSTKMKINETVSSMEDDHPSSPRQHAGTIVLGKSIGGKANIVNLNDPCPDAK